MDKKKILLERLRAEQEKIARGIRGVGVSLRPFTSHHDNLYYAYSGMRAYGEDDIRYTVTSKFAHEGASQIVREILTYEGCDPESIVMPQADLNSRADRRYGRLYMGRKPEEINYDILGLDGKKKVSYTGQLYRDGHARIHYYNNIATTESPYYLSLSIFYTVFAGIVYDMKLEYLMIYVLTPLIMFVAHIFAWINELSSESVYYGRYNSKIRMSLLVGFILFLVSEAMLFLGFFWTFFDRLFALPAHVPQVYTIEHINCTGAPLLGTVLLIASGYCANISFYQAHAYDLSRMMHRISIVLGMAFLAIQVYEYQELMSSISYNVFFSIFLVSTGFHGFHVIVGLLFLLPNDYLSTKNDARMSQSWVTALTQVRSREILELLFHEVRSVRIYHRGGIRRIIRYGMMIDQVEYLDKELEIINQFDTFDSPAISIEVHPDAIDLSYFTEKYTYKVDSDGNPI